MPTELPEPDAQAREHSARLADLIHARIRAAGGWLSFADYMRSALYEPGLGYYSAGATKFGSAGDFVTAPEISPLFSQCLARQCAEVLHSLGGGDMLEPGAGTGRMAADMLVELDRLDCLPNRYFILETSADLRALQAETMAALPAAIAARVVWLDSLPADPLTGVIVANEVADALPVQRFVANTAGVHELGVVSEQGQFVEQTRPASAAMLERLSDIHLPDLLADSQHYSSELSPELGGWVATLSDALRSGVMLLLDYGFSRSEYYLPERSSGTLRCYYRHRAHDNPYLWPGLQDITAWVDFTALAEAATDAGLTVAGYTTQAQFLLASGIEALVTQAGGAGERAQAELAHGLRQLLLPGEMGDAVKVLALTRGDVVLPSGMTGRDMRSSL